MDEILKSVAIMVECLRVYGYPLLLDTLQFEPHVLRADASDAVCEGYNLYSLICLSDPSVLELLNAAGITKIVQYLGRVQAADFKKDSVLRNLVKQMAGPDPTVGQCSNVLRLMSRKDAEDGCTFM
ncbi:hypothetical protein ACLB2K_018671 [Fragaria x ananassa]